MKRWLFALVVCGSACALFAQTDAPADKSPFQPPDTVSVTAIPAPFASFAIGTVMLDVVLSAEGKTEKIEVRRDIASLTEIAVHAVEDWKFSPAAWEKQRVTSRMPVAVTFRPPAPYSDPVPLPARIPQSETAIQAAFQPVEVIHAEFPKYTTTTFAAGAVVLEVPVNEKGEAGDAKVLLDLPPFTDEAKAVVSQWRFRAATYNGRTVSSNVILAFVAPPPPSTPLP